MHFLGMLELKIGDRWAGRTKKQRPYSCTSTWLVDKKRISSLASSPSNPYKAVFQGRHIGPSYPIPIYHGNALDFRVHICLKCKHCSWGDPIFLFSYFRPPTYFFRQFFLQNWNLRPWFSLGDPTPNIHSMERGVWFLREPTPIKKNRG
jgi:hypothetical protein